MSWYVDAKSSNREDFKTSAYQSQSIKFWLGKGETAEIMFISDEMFGVHEHNLHVNGRWKKFTCGAGSCIMCGLQKPKSYYEHYSILDFREYVSKKDGKKHAVTRKDLAAPKDIAAILENRRKEAGGTLLGKRFKVSRFGEKSPEVGNDWVFMPSDKAFDLTKLPPDLRPYDFKEVLKPRPTSEIQAILTYSSNAPQSISRSDLVASDSGYADTPAYSPEDIPF